MNIPLNLDWQQILLHLLNFSILTLGLYLLLYKPIKKFMDDRANLYRNMEKQAEDKIKQAQDMENSYKERLSSIDIEIEAKKARAEQEVKKYTDDIIQNAKEQAEKILSDAQKTAEREREKLLEDAQHEIASMAIAATEKLIAKSASGTLDQFLDAVKKE